MANEKRLIDANALIEDLEAAGANAGKGFAVVARTLIRYVKRCATVDAVEVVHGRWIYEPVEFTYEKDIRCSVCGRYVKEAENYCPNCGAKMDGDGNA